MLVQGTLISWIVRPYQCLFQPIDFGESLHHVKRTFDLKPLQYPQFLSILLPHSPFFSPQISDVGKASERQTVVLQSSAALGSTSFVDGVPRLLLLNSP